MHPKSKFDTMTNAGRKAKAAYERDKKKRSAASEPSKTKGRTPSPPAPKKRKPTAASKDTASNVVSVSTNKDKVRTIGSLKANKQNASMQTAPEKPAKQPGIHDGLGLPILKSRVSSSSSVSRTIKHESSRVTEKPRNLMSFMRESGQMSGLSMPKPEKQPASAKKKESVLVRRTERARRFAQNHSEEQTFTSMTKESQRVCLMDLPLELRQHILSLAVVEAEFFVYPAIATEQPDLAMTSRQVRAEVLPLFYSENVFGIEVPAGTAQSKAKKSIATVSMRPVEQWLAMVQKAGHLRLIRKWAFVWTPLSQKGNVKIGAGSVLADQDVILHLEYAKPGARNGVSYETQLHRQAFCLLPGYEERGKCSLRAQPDWLCDAVASSILHDQDRVKQILSITTELEIGGVMLLGSTCQSVEGCGPDGEEGTTD